MKRRTSTAFPTSKFAAALSLVLWGSVPATHAASSVVKPAKSEFKAQVGVDSETDHWKAKLAMGAGVSQLVQDVPVTGGEKINDSSFQMNLAGTVERKVLEPLSAESGLGLAAQFVSFTPKTSSSSGSNFVVRYLTVPALLRMHFTPEFSAAGGGFAAVPISNLNNLPSYKRLPTTNVGLAVSARWTPPANKHVHWVVEFSIERGLTHIGNAGFTPNHIRNFGALVGILAPL
ncbi:MAG: hypothetical protein AB1540_12655 [Bdellovibrionota bacterium]